MTAAELMKRLGAELLNNKVRHPDTGVVIARFVDADLVLTAEGEEVAANLPAKATRAKAAPAVESAPETPEQPPVEAPAAATAAPEAPAE